MRTRVYRSLLALVLFVSALAATLGSMPAAHASAPVPLYQECSIQHFVGDSGTYRQAPENRDGISVAELEMFTWRDTRTNGYCGPTYGEVRINANSSGFNGELVVMINYGTSGWENGASYVNVSVGPNGQSQWYGSIGLAANNCPTEYAAEFQVANDAASRAVGYSECF